MKRETEKDQILQMDAYRNADRPDPAFDALLEEALSELSSRDIQSEMEAAKALELPDTLQARIRDLIRDADSIASGEAPMDPAARVRNETGGTAQLIRLLSGRRAAAAAAAVFVLMIGSFGVRTYFRPHDSAASSANAEYAAPAGASGDVSIAAPAEASGAIPMAAPAAGVLEEEPLEETFAEAAKPEAAGREAVSAQTNDGGKAKAAVPQAGAAAAPVPPAAPAPASMDAPAQMAAPAAAASGAVKQDAAVTENAATAAEDAAPAAEIAADEEMGASMDVLAGKEMGAAMDVLSGEEGNPAGGAFAEKADNSVLNAAGSGSDRGIYASVYVTGTEEISEDIFRNLSETASSLYPQEYFERRELSLEGDPRTTAVLFLRTGQSGDVRLPEDVYVTDGSSFWLMHFRQDPAADEDILSIVESEILSMLEAAGTSRKDSK